MSEPYEADSQDGAEAMDETVLDEDEGLGEMRTFEELPELLDMTRADGDRDDDESLALDADEFDENAIDEDDAEEDDELNYRAATPSRLEETIFYSHPSVGSRVRKAMDWKATHPKADAPAP